MINVSVIIVAYNSESVIFDCLSSINKNNDIGERLEVIVVDNSPTASLGESLMTRYGSLYKYIHNPKNGGFGQGNNIGAMASKGEVLLFLNPDTILISGVFRELYSAVEKGAVIGGFRLVDPVLKDNDTIGLLPEFNWLTVPRWMLNLLVIKFKVLTKCVFPWGAALFVKKDEFIRAGMFDENIFLCNEEPDLIHRFGGVKVEIINTPIIHLEGHTTVVHDYRFREYLKSTKYYFEKHGLNFAFFIRVFYLKVKVKMCINKFNSNMYENNLSIAKIIRDFF